MLGFREFRLILIAGVLCVCGISAQTLSSAESVTDTSEATTDPDIPEPPIAEPTALPIPFRTCFVEVTQVSQLMAQMSAVLRMLNNDKDYTDSKVVELKKLPELQKYEICSEQRIEQLTEELGWVSRRLWELSIRLQEPSGAEVDLLDKRKIDLIYHLQNIIVFTGKCSVPNLSMHSASFDTKVEYLKYGFNTALTMFQSTRPTRSPPTTTSPSPPAPTSPTTTTPCICESTSNPVESILDPKKSKFELIRLSLVQATAMSEALPQLVSNWYDGNLRNVKVVLDFIKKLPNVIHQMIGYASLYDAMSANSDLESYELTELASQLAGINASVASASEEIPPPVMTRYTQLVNNVWPVYQFYRLIEIEENITCFFKNLKYSKDLDTNSGVLDVSSWSNRIPWTVKSVPPTAMFTIGNLYSSGNFYSPAKRIVQRVNGTPDASFNQWKWIPVQGGKYFRIINARDDEVLFADKSLMNPGKPASPRVFLAKRESPTAHDYLQNADLWTVECR